MTEWRITFFTRFADHRDVIRFVRWASKRMLRLFNGRNTRAPDVQEVKPDGAD